MVRVYDFGPQGPGFDPRQSNGDYNIMCGIAGDAKARLRSIYPIVGCLQGKHVL